MSKNRSLGLTALFLAISILVSGSLVLNLHGAYAGSRHLAPEGSLHIRQGA